MRTALIAAGAVVTVSISYPAAAAGGPLVRDYLAWPRFGL